MGNFQVKLIVIWGLSLIIIYNFLFSKKIDLRSIGQRYPLSPYEQVLLVEGMINEFDQLWKEHMKGPYANCRLLDYYPNHIPPGLAISWTTIKGRLGTYLQNRLLIEPGLARTTLDYLESELKKETMPIFCGTGLKQENCISIWAREAIIRLLFHHLSEEKKLRLAKRLLREINKKQKNYIEEEWALFAALLLIEHGYLEREASRFLCEYILSFSNRFLVSETGHFVGRLIYLIGSVRPRSSAILYLILNLKHIGMEHLMLKPIVYLCRLFEVNPVRIRRDRDSILELYDEWRNHLLTNYKNLTFKMLKSPAGETVKGEIVLEVCETGDKEFIEDFEWIQDRLHGCVK